MHQCSRCHSFFFARKKRSNLTTFTDDINVRVNMVNFLFYPIFSKIYQMLKVQQHKIITNLFDLLTKFHTINVFFLFTSSQSLFGVLFVRDWFIFIFIDFYSIYFDVLILHSSILFMYLIIYLIIYFYLYRKGYFDFIYSQTFRP